VIKLYKRRKRIKMKKTSIFKNQKSYLLLLLILLFIFLLNFRIFSFDKGFAKDKEDYNNSYNSISEIIDFYSDIEEVEYYKNPVAFLNSESSEFYIVIKTETNGLFIISGTDNDISTLEAFAILNSNLNPQYIVPISIYIYLIVCLIIIFMAFYKKKL
jgi:hypothetical protein